MCCKCCQYCLESCYWHLIEKRFCYDESIALYEDPEKAAPEKNNNMFDNMAFYDSVSVLAGRSVVTIDEPPVAELEAPLERKVVVRQPLPQAGGPRRLQWREDRLAALRSGYFSRSAPLICDRAIAEEEDLYRSHDTIVVVAKEIDEETTTQDCTPTPEDDDSKQAPPTAATPTTASPAPAPPRAGLTSSKSELLLNPVVEAKKRSLMERRMSKSLYLRIEQPKELPVVRQNSMPKFYLDTPQPHQAESCVMPAPSAALASPVPPSATAGFVFDLQSVVQMHRELQGLAQLQQGQGRGQGTALGRGQSVAPPTGQAQRDDRASSRLLHMRDRIKLRRVKSSLATVFPHAHHM